MCIYSKVVYIYILILYILILYILILCIYIYGRLIINLLLTSEWGCHGMILEYIGLDMMFVCLKMASMPFLKGGSMISKLGSTTFSDKPKCTETMK